MIDSLILLKNKKKEITILFTHVKPMVCISPVVVRRVREFGADGQGHSIYCSNQISFSLKNKHYALFSDKSDLWLLYLEMQNQFGLL